MILPLNHQVTSLALSQRLKALGVRQDTSFLWDLYDQEDDGTNLYKLVARCPDIYDDFAGDYAAYTVAELGVLLPDKSISSKEENRWVAEELKNRCFYEDGGNYPNGSPFGEASTEAEARGLMLQYLIENHIIEI